MANKNEGEVALDIGGKSLTIKIKSRVLGNAETMLGIDSLIGRQLGYRNTAVLLYLLCRDQGIGSIDEAYDLLDTYLAPVQAALYEAIDFFYQSQTGLIEETASESPGATT